MLKVNHLCVAVLSTVFGAVAVRGQFCAQVVNGVAVAQVDTNGVAVFSAGITEISNGMFQDCLELKEVVIPATVVTVGDFAFNRAYNLERVTFAPVSQLLSLGELAFDDTGNLKAIVLPNSLETLGGAVFRDSGLQSIFIPSSILTSGPGSSKIGANAFDGTCVEDLPYSYSPNPGNISFTVCNCEVFTDSINMCPALKPLTPVAKTGKMDKSSSPSSSPTGQPSGKAKSAKTGKIPKKAKSAKNGKIPKVAKTASFAKNHKASNAQGSTVGMKNTNTAPTTSTTAAPVKPPTADY